MAVNMLWGESRVISRIINLGGVGIFWGSCQKSLTLKQKRLSQAQIGGVGLKLGVGGGVKLSLVWYIVCLFQTHARLNLQYYC